MEKSGQETTSGRSRYRFLRRIATGGMAELYLGQVSGVGGVTKHVALKRMLPAHAQDADYAKMFLAEARLASTLQHPNIVQTYDVIQSGDEYVMVMEYLEGTDLQQLRRLAQAKEIPVTFDHVMYIVRGVLSGLHYAHERPRMIDGRQLGIVHRDVSPQNIFLTYDGGVKLLDFGIARTEQASGTTGSGVLKGKVLYMAPEQCGGGMIDRRTDLYAVGVVLYQLLTGHVPHRGKNVYDTMRSIIDDPAPSPRLTNADIPPSLESIVLRALQKRPQDRFDSARDMLEELEQLAQAEGMHMSTVEVSGLVDTVLGPRSTLPRAPVVNLDEMPSMIELGGRSSDPPPDPAQDHQRAVLADTEHALVRRVSGVTVVNLSGVLDERFDHKAVAPHLRGEILFDTSDVTRITSFGIRSLLSLFSESRSGIDNLYHVRCSVAFVNQITMIRALLAGGRILSFHAPFIDPVNGSSFSVLLQGEEGQRAVSHHTLPEVSSPTDANVPAEFDDDASLYLNFAQDYLGEVPSHIRPAMRSLEEQPRKLDIELNVRDDLTVLTIRRPIRSDARWKRIMMGLEGRVRFDLSESPSTSAAGIESFVKALEVVAPELQSVELVGAPLALCEAAAQVQSLGGFVAVYTVQVDARCNDCGTERRTTIDAERLRDAGPVVVASGCGRCGGALAVTSDLHDFDTISAPQARDTNLPSLSPTSVNTPATARAGATGCLRQLGLIALLSVGTLLFSSWVA